MGWERASTCRKDNGHESGVKKAPLALGISEVIC